jgi:hypothetical protein
MSVRSRFANRHKRQDWPLVRHLIHTGDATMLHDTDREPGPESQPNQPAQLVTTRMGFQHPPGFEPAAFLIIGLTKEGQPFINMPHEHPHLCLHMATILLEKASELAVRTMQASHLKQSPILQVPPGTQLPPFRWPAGRG